jgi:hypothetical protein
MSEEWASYGGQGETSLETPPIPEENAGQAEEIIA